MNRRVSIKANTPVCLFHDALVDDFKKARTTFMTYYLILFKYSIIILISLKSLLKLFNKLPVWEEFTSTT